MQTKGYFMSDNIALEACNSTRKILSAAQFYCRKSAVVALQISLSSQEMWIAKRDGEVSVTYGASSPSRVVSTQSATETSQLLRDSSSSRVVSTQRDGE